ncbi:MAG: ATPase, partial [bacterium]|nr:ATPase [bacterium]
MATVILKNPFVIGRYVSDHYFCDREKETAFLAKQVLNGRNVALISPRRMGKTGLIHHLFNQEVVMDSYIPIFVDIYASTSLAEFVYLFGKEIYLRLKTQKSVWSERF